MIRNSPEWVWLPIGAVTPYPGHARRHNKRQLGKLKQLIQRFGQVIPVVVDRDNVLVDGHAVWSVMRELGSGEIAAVIVANGTDPEIKALRLALNRIPQDGAWDGDSLRKELESLVSLSFDLELRLRHRRD